MTRKLKSNISEVLNSKKDFKMSLGAIEHKVTACAKILAESNLAKMNQDKNKKVIELAAGERFESEL